MSKFDIPRTNMSLDIPLTEPTTNTTEKDPKSGGRWYSYVFTLFNHPTREDLERFLSTLPKSMDYWCCGDEIAPTTETHHWQGCIHFKNAIWLSAMRKKFKYTIGTGKQKQTKSHGWIDRMRGTWQQAYDYSVKTGKFECMKDALGNDLPIPRQGERGDLSETHKHLSLRNISKVKYGIHKHSNALAFYSTTNDLNADQ